MTLAAYIVLIAVIVILACMARLLMMRVQIVAKIETYPLVSDEIHSQLTYWQTKQKLFQTKCIMNHHNFSSLALDHGMLIQYDGPVMNGESILFCMYDMKDVDSLLMAIQRFEKNRELAHHAFYILYGDKPNEVLSKECVEYFQKHNKKVDVILSTSIMFSYVLQHKNYVFLGTHRKQTLSLKIEGQPNIPDNCLLSTPITYSTLHTLKDAFDHRIDLQYLIHPQKAFQTLLSNKQLAQFTCNTLYKECGEIKLSCIDDESQEKLVSYCQNASADAQKKIYVLDQHQSGKDSESCWLVDKISDTYGHLNHVKIIKGYFVDDEESALEDIAKYHIAFTPPQILQLSMRDYFVSILSK